MEVKLDLTIPNIITAVLIILKLLGMISISWIWVFSPIWISMIIALIVLIICYIKL